MEPKRRRKFEREMEKMLSGWRRLIRMHRVSEDDETIRLELPGRIFADLEGLNPWSVEVYAAAFRRVLEAELQTPRPEPYAHERVNAAFDEMLASERQALGRVERDEEGG